MKPLKCALSLFALVLVFLCCNKSFAQEGFITVKDYPSNLWDPEIDLESHKTGDVEFYNALVQVDGYWIIWYHDISGELRDYYFLLQDTTYYDQGFYNWKNDTIVRVKIYNSETKQEFTIELYATREKNSSGGAILVD